MQPIASRTLAAPRPRRAIVASSAIALLMSAHHNVRADDTTAANDIKLPDVTVQQTPAKRPPAVAQKAKTKTEAKPAAKAVKPPSTATPEITVASPPSDMRPAAAPATGSTGTPSAGIASVSGASGAGAQAAAAVDMTRFEDAPVFSAADILREVPGVSLKQGNGPRDMGISIRGSNARNGFGIRNIVILDDGFPVTQPDGLSRSDLIDPHAYAGVDVWRGPSSALFGNYATGGAINFRTFPGGAIDGVEYGIDVGSFNYFNNYAIGGKRGENWEASVFTSDVRGDGYFGYSAFDTQTVNALMTWKPSATDTFTFKFINNTIDTELPFRLSLNQFKQNSFQKGCATAATAAAGCAITVYSATGNTALVNNALQPGAVRQTAEQAGANRDDRRTIGGFRWEHAFDAATTGQVQVVVDDRNISQPTGATSGIGDYLSYNVSTGLTNRSVFAGLPTLSYLGAYWNYLPVDGKTYNVAPGGNARLGLLQSEVTGSTTNFGVRAREEVRVATDVAVIAGAAVERTNLDGAQRSYKYSTSGSLTSTTITSADREMTNIAPELGILYTPVREWQWRARVASGYGTPQFSNLFINSDGQPGNNTDLKSQRNVGFDVGGDWTPAPGLTFSVTGFYEFFRNEIVSQAPAGNSGSSFSFNAPASEHRGVEAAVDFALADGLRLTASYIRNDQIYTDYSEQISGANLASRDGNKIPGVSPNEFTTRLSYDFTHGPLKGIGAFAEYEWHDGFFMENANLLKAPGYELVNVNVHYNTEFSGGPVRSLITYFEIRNLFDETYISSANNIPDRLTGNLADSTGSIYAGAPRTYFGGMKVRF